MVLFKVKGETRFFAQSNVVINAMNDYKKAFNDLASMPLPAAYPQRLELYYNEELKAKLGLESHSIKFPGIAGKGNSEAG